MKKILISILSILPILSLAHAQDVPQYFPQKAIDFDVRGGVGNTFEKLKAGKDVTIAYLGGSITAMNGWRNKTTDWLRREFPNANVKEIHAAIGGTGSDLGAFRVGRDALDHNPDLLFVEFAVNDGGAAPENIWKQMEGIVRQTWKRNPRTDIVFVYTIHNSMCDTVRKGEFPRSAGAMEMLADFYQIPSVNFQTRVVKMIDEGTLVFKGDAPTPETIVFSGDDCHPKDAGHQLYFLDIERAFNAMRDIEPTDHAPKLEKIFIEGNLENAKSVPITREMLHGNWKIVQEGEPFFGFSNRLGTVWIANEPGSAVEFKFRGSVVKMYDILGPNFGQVYVTLDGVKKGPFPRFDSYCSWSRLATLTCGNNLDPNEIHTIRVEIDAQQPSRSSVPESAEKPEKYDGTNYVTGLLLLVGEIVDTP
ncbi:MAG: GDSL-type esterase/lipase family protein [Planctomycetia bacterium]|nr:GDSL-type esterase/lipase family protein [Planctomycetia bacterium]